MSLKKTLYKNWVLMSKKNLNREWIISNRCKSINNKRGTKKVVEDEHKILYLTILV